jgi:predicted nucleic acid-binding protein
LTKTKPKVYVETSVISYLTSRPSQNIIMAGHQQITYDWWQTAYNRFELVASQLVIQEASKGDPKASQERLNVLNELTLLEVTDHVIALAQQFVNSSAIPQKAIEDAIHIAISVVHGIEYLVTWNCKHIANIMMRPIIEAVCRKNGYEPVLICTPEQLLETE